MGHLGDAVQAVNNLLALALKLKIIGQVLPAAAATQSEVSAPRLAAQLRRLLQPLDAPLGVGVLFAGQANRCNVARSALGDKHDHIIDARQGVALGCHAGDFNALQNGQLFAFPCHRFQYFLQSYEIS